MEVSNETSDMFPFGSKRIACRSATIHAALFILSNRSANKVEIKIKEINIYLIVN